MMIEKRTEIYPGSWLQCYRCRKPTLVHELVARVDVTGSAYTWWGFPLVKWRGIVSLCPSCEGQERATEATKRKWQGVALGCAAISFFAWQSVGMAGYWAALGVLALGACWRRFGRQTQVVIWRKQ